MAKPRPVTDDDRQQVAALHAQGLTRNAIADRLGRSGRTISGIAEKLGLDFDRSRTAAAAQAKAVDARARRAALAVALLDDAEQLRKQLFAPATVHNFGGRDNTYNEHELPQPPFRDQLAIMQAVGAAVDRAVKLDLHDADPGVDAAKSMLGALAAGLGAAYDQLQQAEADDA